MGDEAGAHGDREWRRRELERTRYVTPPIESGAGEAAAVPAPSSLGPTAPAPDIQVFAEPLAQVRENVDHAEALLTRDPFGEAERSLAATLLREALAAIERAETWAAGMERVLRELVDGVRILDVMLREPAAEGLMSAEDYRSYLSGAWLGVDEKTAAARAVLSARETSAYEDLAHATIRMLQALDAYWLHCDGLPAGRFPRSESMAEDWWIRFESYRRRVEALLSRGQPRAGSDGLSHGQDTPPGDT